MNVKDRERKVVIVGGIVAALLVLVIYVVMPLARKWNQMGNLIEPKRAYVARLRDRVHGHDSLVTRRNVLVRRLGSLAGAEAVAEEQDSGTGTASSGPVSSTETKKDGEKPDSATADSDTPAESIEESASGKSGSEDGGEAADSVDTGTAESGEAADGGSAEPAPQADAAEDKPDDPTPDEPAASEKDVSAQAVSLAAHLERTAGSSGVKVKRITPKTRTTGKRGTKHFTPVTVQMSVETDIQCLIKLLYALEKGDRFVRVEQMQLRRNSKKGNTMNVTLDVQAYEAATG